MDQDLTLEQMAEFLYGKPVRPAVMFFDGEIRDGTETELQGRRVMTPALFIRIQVPKENVDVTRTASLKDMSQYAEELESYYEAKRAKHWEAEQAAIEAEKAEARRKQRQVRRKAKAPTPVLNWPVDKTATGT